MKKSFLILLTLVMVLCSTTFGVNAARKVTMYSPNGETAIVWDYEVDNWKAVGWYKYPVATVYAPDGRTLIVAKSEISSYVNVGWYEYPVTVVGKEDTGYPCIIKLEELDEYLDAGWTLPYYNKNNILITVADGVLYYEGLSAKSSYIRFRVQNNTNESVYIEPRDVKANNTAVSSYCSPYKVPSGTSQYVKLKVDDLKNTSTFMFKLWFNLKVRTSSYKVNERIFTEPIYVSFR